MKVLTKKLLTAFRVKMNTYYWELEKERRLTNSLEELVLRWRGSSQLFLFLFKPKAKWGEGADEKGQGPRSCRDDPVKHIHACTSPSMQRLQCNRVT